MILVFVETRDGKIKKASLEVLSEAKRRAGELGIEVAAAAVGTDLDIIAGEVFPCGAAKLYLLENPALDAYSAQGHAQALFSLVNGINPGAVFFSATAMGRDLAPRLAAKLGAGLASDCTKLAVKDGRLEFTRPIFAGKAVLSFRLKSCPRWRPCGPTSSRSRPPAPSGGEVIRKTVEIPEGIVKGRLWKSSGRNALRLDVTEADVIVSGGRGLKGPENFALLKELAAVIPKSAVGASRSAVDSGWIGHQHQVGQTGKTVSPNLYLAFGISGAIQHLAGISSSKLIVAVNKDPEAPIFKVADYGIVGDLFQVIPPLKEALKKALSE